MGVFDSLTTSVSGLQAQSFALQNISGNIANSTTVGFKRVDTSFVDLIPQTPANQQLAGSVNSYSRNTTLLQGSISQTGIATNLAINGDGFFIVQSRTGNAGGQPSFSGIDRYTRRGDFAQDNNGYLVNGAGNYLEGIPLDPVTGSLLGSKPGVLKISSKDLPALATSNITYQANLPPTPATAASQAPNAPANSQFFYPTPGAPVGNVGLAVAGQVSSTEEPGFLNYSIDGGAKTVYTANGTPINVQLRWAKLDPAANPPTAPATETWQLYYRTDDTTNPVTKWVQIGGATNGIGFDNQGTLVGPTTSSTQTFTLDGVVTNPVKFDYSAGLTQYAGSTSSGSAAGQVGGVSITADGYTAGSFQSLSLDTGGRLVGNYTNGQIVPLAQISEAHFKNSDGLTRQTGGTFQETLDSGQPVVGSAGAELSGGAVESSNTDIAAEFTKLIVTQQAYSANTKVITTANTILQDILQVIR